MGEASQCYLEKKCVGKKCTVMLSNGEGTTGIVKSVEEGWLMIEVGTPSKEKIDMINTDYIIRIQEM